MMKRLTKAWAMMLAMMMLCSMVMVAGLTQAAVADGSSSVVLPDFEYAIANGKATIVRYTGNAKSVVVPHTIAGYPVTMIGSGAFQNNSRLEKIQLPDSVTEIGYRAFANCSNLSQMSSTPAADLTFNGYTSYSVTDIERGNGLAVSWSASNAKKYFVKAFLLNEMPSGGATEQQELAVKWIADDQTSETVMTIAADALAGGQYLKIAVGAAGQNEGIENARWSWIGFGLKSSLKIVTQPQSVTVPNGALAEVKVEAEGDGLTYKWYYKNATMKQFAYTSAFTGDTYSVEMSQGRSGRQLYCIVSDQYGNSVQSDTVTISMGSSLEITKQPENVTVPNGALAEVKVEAQGEGLTYKWYYKNATMKQFAYTSAFTGDTYSVEMSQGRSGRQLYCIVSDQYGNSVQSDTVTITMGSLLEITKQPETVYAAEGDIAAVTVEAQGEGLTYKWYYKNSTSTKFVYSSATVGNTYSVEMTKGRSGRQLYCIITDKYGNSVQTDTVAIIMATPLEITKQPEDVMAAAGETVNVTVEAKGEGLTYKWYYKNPTSSKFVYSSATVGNTYTVEMSKGRSGRQLYCIVSDQYGNSVQSNTVTISMGTELKITKQPAHVFADVGEQVEVTVEAQGEGLTYKWYYKNPTSSKFVYSSTMKGNAYTVEMSKSRSGRQLYCVITDKYGNSVQTDTVSMLLTGSALITRQPASVAVYEGQTAKVSFDVIGEGLTFKWYYKNSSATKFTYTSTFNSNTYTAVMNATRSGRQIYCEVTDMHGATVRTDTVTISMISAPKSDELSTADNVAVTTDYTNEDIPQAIVKAGFETVEKIEAALSKKLEAGQKELIGKQLYNAELLLVKDGVVRTASAVEDFPEGGKVIVEMPVPEESNPMLHKYVVAHMYGMDAFGKKAGGIELCEANVVYSRDGRAMIRFETTGLSPVMVAWTLQDFNIDLPQTGDSSQLALWIALVGIAGVGVYLLRKRKLS